MRQLGVVCTGPQGSSRASRRIRLCRRRVARHRLWIHTDLGLHPSSATCQLVTPQSPYMAVPASPRPGEQQSLSHGNKCTKGIRHRTPRAEDLDKC